MLFMLSYSGILRIFHLKKTIVYTIIRVFLIQIFMLVKNYKLSDALYISQKEVIKEVL